MARKKLTTKRLKGKKKPKAKKIVIAIAVFFVVGLVFYLSAYTFKERSLNNEFTKWIFNDVDSLIEDDKKLYDRSMEKNRKAVKIPPHPNEVVETEYREKDRDYLDDIIKNN